MTAILNSRRIDPYVALLDGQHFALGTFCHFVDEAGRPKGHYICTYLGGCNEHFKFTDDLQNHFEHAHFAYSRINPAHCYICSSCNAKNNSYSGFNLPTAVCTTCRQQGGIELWIFGRYIRSGGYQRYPPDNQAVGLMSAQSSAHSYASSDTSLSMRRTGAGSDEDLNQGMNQGGYHRNIGKSPSFRERSFIWSIQ